MNTSMLHEFLIYHGIRTTILLIFSGTLLFKTLRSLRAHRLKERYVLVFLITSLPFLVLALWPNGIVFLSRTMDIEKPTLMVMALAGISILLIFELLSIVSQQDRKIASLAQMLALLMEKEKKGERAEKVDSRLLDAQKVVVETTSNPKSEVRNPNQ